MKTPLLQPDKVFIKTPKQAIHFRRSLAYNSLKHTIEKPIILTYRQAQAPHASISSRLKTGRFAKDSMEDERTMGTATLKKNL